MSDTSKSRQALALAGWLIASFAVSAIGAAASIRTRAFYGGLVQPEWAPPGWLFGPVWTVLFTFMGIAAWLVWRQGGFRAQRLPLGLFLAQWVLNALWSWLFFAWQLGGAALLDIVALWALIAACMVSFWRVNRIAGALLAPYLGWVTFAGALNYALWQLNPDLLG